MLVYLNYIHEREYLESVGVYLSYVYSGTGVPGSCRSISKLYSGRENLEGEGVYLNFIQEQEYLESVGVYLN